MSVHTGGKEKRREAAQVSRETSGCPECSQVNKAANAIVAISLKKENDPVDALDCDTEKNSVEQAGRNLTLCLESMGSTGSAAFFAPAIKNLEKQ